MLSKTVRIHQTGGPEVLRFEQMEVGEPGPDEMCLRIEAIGLNRAEVAFREGFYLDPPKLPARIGYEAAGIIEAIGKDVIGFTVGEAVCVIPGFSMNQYGVYAEHALVPASAVLKRPGGLNAAAASSIWMQYLTAYGALIDIAKVSRGDAVLITAASSSVGLASIQMCNAIGAIPIAITRTEEKAATLRAQGAAHVIVTDTQDLVAEVMRTTDKKGAKLAFDAIVGPIVATLAAALGPQGMLIIYGNLSGKKNETLLPFGPMMGKGLSVRGYVVFELIFDPQRLEAAKLFIEQGLQSKQLVPVIDKTFPFDRIADAHRYLESNQQLGKIVVTVP
jgi:NADPH:quinone reductase-like Zn-dependent oxidoreductase